MNKCSVQIVSRLDSQSKFQTFVLFPGRHFPGVHTVVQQHGGSILGSPYWSLPARPLTLQPDRQALVHREIRIRSPLCVVNAPTNIPKYNLFDNKVAR